MTEFQGHEFGRREDAERLEGGLGYGGYLPEGRHTADYRGMMVYGSVTVAGLGFLGCLLSALGY